MQKEEKNKRRKELELRQSPRRHFTQFGSTADDRKLGEFKLQKTFSV